MATPAILRAADRLLRRDTPALEDQGAPASSSLTERVERLERTTAAQRDVVQDVAVQADELTRALRTLGIQIIIAIVLAAAALGFAIVALVRTL